jgi:predicted RND superfamily exporter protein
MVVGIVAKNGILLLDANQKYRAEGMSLEEAIVHAGRRRLRPITMTAMAAVAGMLPLALAIGAGSQMLQPLAIAVIGGILISMLLSLIVTPAIQYFPGTIAITLSQASVVSARRYHEDTKDTKFTFAEILRGLRVFVISGFEVATSAMKAAEWWKWYNASRAYDCPRLAALHFPSTI